nr:hypothetical protein [Nitrospirota bacterium]
MERDFPLLSPTIRWGRTLAGAASLLLVLGCQPAPKAESSAAHSGLIGKTKQEIVTCAGPSRSEAHRGQQTVLIYHKDAPAFDHSFFGSKASVGAVHHECTAVLTLQDDRIVEVEYRPEPPSVAGEDHCEEIFYSCVP